MEILDCVAFDNTVYYLWWQCIVCYVYMHVCVLVWVRCNNSGLGE